jgi:outer membrane immunogenic protein
LIGEKSSLLPKGDSLPDVKQVNSACDFRSGEMRKLGSIIAFSLAGSSAFAADLGVKAPLPAPVTQAANWTGFYLGGNLGGVVADASGTSDFTDTTSGSIAPSNPQTDSFSKGGLLGGVYGGFNWQFSPIWVAGLEADWDWTDTKYSFCRQTDPGSTACADNGHGFETVGSKTEWLATFRGRLGVAWENWLFYATGGAALGRVRTDLTLNCLVNGCGASSTVTLLAASSSSTTKAGWVAGLGAELMLSRNWSARAEWLHVDLGTITDSLPTAGSSGTQPAIWSRTESFDEFRRV